MDIKLYGWMINELNLSRNELLVFATVFSMRHDGWFKVSRKEIHRWVRISPRQISRIIQNLSNIGIIEHRFYVTTKRDAMLNLKSLNT